LQATYRRSQGDQADLQVCVWEGLSAQGRIQLDQERVRECFHQVRQR
jgi:hypothetical protein